MRKIKAKNGAVRRLRGLASGCTGVKRSTGQHPGGIVVVPDYMEVEDITPVQYPADDTSSEWKTTHFDYHAFDANLLKLDILGHDDPTMMRMLQDLTGVDPTTIPMNDPKVMSIFNSTEAIGVTPEQIRSPVATYGVPEMGTKFVRQMLQETQPTIFCRFAANFRLVSWNRRLAGQCPGADQKRHMQHQDRYWLSRRYHAVSDL